MNDFKSHIFQSAVGIPQGSVISPVLCNVYTSDSMSNIVINHAEFADDTSVKNSDSSINQACGSVNKGLVTEKVWCCHWNMSIAAEKTEVMVLPWDSKEVSEEIVVKYDRAVLKTTKVKILEMVLDNNLTFKEQI